MNDFRTPDNNDHFDDLPPHDELDSLLRQWHETNRAQAAAGRERLMRAIAQEPALGTAARESQSPGKHAAATSGSGGAVLAVLSVARRAMMSRYTPIAASLTLLVVIATLLIPMPGGSAMAQEVMVPLGGRLDAVDDEGQLVGACPLTHTDVDIEVSGRFSRVTVTQQYDNPYQQKIEAVYTFPLSHRAAVDRMTMTVGDRVVQGEVKERQEARQIYQAAREAGYVASLLEQERPNIFTQSIANIEPGASIEIEISYVETLQIRDGEFRFDFPMVVAPRYIPGTPSFSPAFLPAELDPRQGVIMRGPAELRVTEAGQIEQLGSLQTGKLDVLLDSATPIRYPGELWWGEENPGSPVLWYRFEAHYADGSVDRGTLHTDGTGQLNGRWFYFDPDTTWLDDHGTGFEPNTDQVPDASRITPMPVHPDMRAGHDISLTMTIDSGGPGLLDIDSELHQIVTTNQQRRPDGRPSRVTLALMDQKEIPNRDFLLTWRQSEESIEEAIFTHAGDYEGFAGGFVTLMLNPPARVEDDQVRSRELVFVLDCSGSMEGFPIEKAKDVISRALGTMRPGDTFNIVTFNNTAESLWDTPRPFSDENLAAAQQYINSRQGGGGTEMNKAVLMALRDMPGTCPHVLTLEELADLPADGRDVRVRAQGDRFTLSARPNDFVNTWDSARYGENGVMNLRGEHRFQELDDEAEWVLAGKWITDAGYRWFDVASVERVDDTITPLRLVLFVTDGEVGNDDQIVGSIREHSDATRLFSIGIGNSPNRSLLDGMARAGRGASDFVSLEGDAEAVVQRFVDRVATPVLTDIEIELAGDIEITDWLSPDGDAGALPDLYDHSPLVLHGRYDPASSGAGSLTIRGLTGAGRYERTIDLDLADEKEANDVIAKLWARTKADHFKQAGDVSGIITLGTSFDLLTEHTSFVAVEKSRLTMNGKSMLVAVPIEMVQGQSWHGTFGGPERLERIEQVVGELTDVDVDYLGLALQVPETELEPEALMGGIGADIAVAGGEIAEAVEALEVDEIRTRMIELAQSRRIATGEEAQQQKEEWDALIAQLKAAGRGRAEAIDSFAVEELAADPIAGLTRFLDESGELREQHKGVTELSDLSGRLAQLQETPARRLGAARSEVVRESERAYITAMPDAAGSYEALSNDRRFKLVEDNIARYGELSNTIDQQLARIPTADAYFRYEAKGDVGGVTNKQAWGEAFGIPAGTPPDSIHSITGPVGAPIRATQGLTPLALEDTVALRESLDFYAGFEGVTFGRPIDTESLSRDIALRHRNFDVADLPTTEGQIVRLPQQRMQQAGTELLGETSYGIVDKHGQVTPLELPWQHGAPVDEARRVARVRADLDAAGEKPGSGGGGAGGGGGDLVGGRGAGVRGVAAVDAPANLPQPPDVTIESAPDASRGFATTTLDAGTHLYFVQPPEQVDLYDWQNAVKLSVAEQNAAYGMETAPILGAMPVVGDLFITDWGINADALFVIQPQPATGLPASIVVREQMPIVIYTLAVEGRLDESRQLSAFLLEAQPDFDLTQQIEAVFADEKLDDESRLTMLESIADEATKRIRAAVSRAIERLEREMRLDIVLDPRLRPFASGSGFPDELVDMYNGFTPEDTHWHEGGVLLSILVQAVTDDLVAELESLGLKVISRADRMHFVVAAVPLGRLDEVALTNGVRWIEPAKVSAE